MTNSEWLLANLGDDPEYWPGHKVTLYLAPLWEGAKRQGIRIRSADTPSTPANNGGGQLPSPRSRDFDDDIPY